MTTDPRNHLSVSVCRTLDARGVVLVRVIDLPRDSEGRYNPGSMGVLVIVGGERKRLTFGEVRALAA